MDKIHQFTERLPEPLQNGLRVFRVIAQDFERCDLLKHASAMAYVTLFSLVPSLAAVFGVISLFKPFLGPDSSLYNKLRGFILDNLATGSGEQVIQSMEAFLKNLDMTKIGLTGFAGIVVTLILLLKQIEVALNRIWLVQKPRNLITRFVYFWTFLTLGTFILGLTVGIVSGFSLDRLNPFSESMVPKGFWVSATPFLATLLFFTLLYKIVPNCPVRLKHAFWGALPATILLTAGGKLYAWYTTYLASYKAFYGALAAVPIFLMWLYIIWVVTLFGALLAWRSEQSFIVDDLDDTPVAPQNAKERLASLRLQTLIPYLLTFAIYHRFEEAKGKGLNGYELAEKLNIPTPFIAESLEALLEHGVIVAKGSDEQGSMSSEYFPAYPSGQLNLQELHETLGAPNLAWLEHWKCEYPLDLHKLVAHLWESEAKSIPKKPLVELLKQAAS